MSSLFLFGFCYMLSDFLFDHDFNFNSLRFCVHKVQVFESVSNLNLTFLWKGSRVYTVLGLIFPNLFRSSAHFCSNWLMSYDFVQSTSGSIFQFSIEFVHLFFMTYNLFDYVIDLDMHNCRVIFSVTKIMFLETYISLSIQKSMSYCPVLLYLPSPNFPIIFSRDSSPVLAIKSPIIIRKLFFGVWSTICYNLS